MKKIFYIPFIIVSLLVFASCNSQSAARNFGTDVNINVEKGYKVTSATWKNNDIFYFIEPMEVDYKPKVKKFVESSNFGVLESKVIFRESK